MPYLDSLAYLSRCPACQHTRREFHGKTCRPCHRLITLIGFPDENVCVAGSTIPGAGRGLFAKREFVAGEHITEYGGMLLDSVPAVTDWTTMISKTCFVDGNPERYGAAIRSAAKEDRQQRPGRDRLRVGLAQFANSPVDKSTRAPKEPRKRKGKRRDKIKEAAPLPSNARLVVDRKDRCVRLEATKHIEDWEEIVVPYLRTSSGARRRSVAGVAGARSPPPPPPPLAVAAASALVELASARPAKRLRKD